MKRIAATVIVLLLAACSKTEQAKPKDADPAVAAIQDKISSDSANWQLQAQLADELRRKDRLEEAAQAATKAFELAPSPGTEARLVLAKVYAVAPNRSAAAINLVKEVEKKKREQGEAVDEVKIAEVYAVLGDPAAVFRWLDRAVAANSPNLATLSTNPDFANVKDDPRFATYLSAKAAQ